MRTLWVFCAIVVLFTMHCLTIPRQRQTAPSTRLTPHSATGTRDGGGQLYEDDDTVLDREIAEIKSIATAAQTKIEHITFSGNQRLSQDILASTLQELGVKAGAVCDPDCNFRAAGSIESFYEAVGYLSARVKLVNGGSRHDREISFEIDEGPLGMLAGIYFTGNQSIPSKVLRPCLATRVQTLPNNLPWLFWSPRGFVWDKDIDEHVLRMHYLLQGFSNAQISHVKHLSQDRTRLTVEYIIDEGPAGGPVIQQVAAEVDSSTRTDDRGASRGPVNAFVSASGELRTPSEPDLRDLDRISISGVETFNSEDLCDALRFEFDSVLASHPGGDLGGFLQSLEKQIRSGYRHGGFPDVAIQAAVNEQREQIEIRVTEGARYRCGELKFIHALPPESPLRAQISDPNLLVTYWKRGKPAPFDETTRAKMTAIMQSEFASAGYFHPTFDFTINRHEESGIADLQVTVEQLGPRAIVGQIEITGAERDSAADIFNYLDLHSGVTCDSDLPRRLKRRLWESGRYLSAEVNTSPASDVPRDETESMNLKIELIENEQAPGLARQLTPAEESLIKLGEWLRRWSHGHVAEDIVAMYTEIPERILAESLAEGDLQPSAMVPGESKYSLRMVIGPKRGQTLAFTALAGYPEPLFDILIASFPDRLVVASPQRLTKLEIANPKGHGFCLSLQRRMVRKRTGQLGIRRWIGATTRFSRPKPNATAFEFDVDVSPAHLLSLAHGPQTTCTLADGITTVIDTESTLRIDAASGRLIEYREEFPNGALTLTIHTATQALETELNVIEGTLATATAEYDSESPWKSASEFLVDELRFGAQRSGLVEAERSLCALRKALGLWLPPNLAELSAHHDRLEELSSNGKFWIPSRSDLFTDAELRKPGSIYRREIVAKWVLPLCRELLPKTGWWWPEVRDAALCWATGEAGLIAGLRQAAAPLPHERETSGPEVGDGAAPGPFGEVLLAIIDAGFKIEPRQSVGGMNAAQKTTLPFRNDYGPLLKGDSWLGRYCVSLAEALRQLDDEDLAALELLLPVLRPYDGTFVGLEDIKHDPDTPIEHVLPAILERLVDERKAGTSSRTPDLVD